MNDDHGFGKACPSGNIWLDTNPRTPDKSRPLPDFDPDKIGGRTDPDEMSDPVVKALKLLSKIVKVQANLLKEAMDRIKKLEGRAGL